MSPEVRDRIFEPFLRRKSEQGFRDGAGHGLRNRPATRRFIHVYSEPGQGSLFHVYLPVMEVAIAESTREFANVGKSKNLQGSETILLAEDHDSIRELTRLGYQVLAAADGSQALRLAELERPDLAVLDVVMPHMGGAATAAQLLQHMPDCQSSSPAAFPKMPTTPWPRCQDPTICRSRTARRPWQVQFGKSWIADSPH